MHVSFPVCNRQRSLGLAGSGHQHGIQIEFCYWLNNHGFWIKHSLLSSSFFSFGWWKSKRRQLSILSLLSSFFRALRAARDKICSTQYIIEFDMTKALLLSLLLELCIQIYTQLKEHHNIFFYFQYMVPPNQALHGISLCPLFDLLDKRLRFL